MVATDTTAAQAPTPTALSSASGEDNDASLAPGLAKAPKDRSKARVQVDMDRLVKLMKEHLHVDDALARTFLQREDVKTSMSQESAYSGRYFRRTETITCVYDESYFEYQQGIDDLRDVLSHMGFPSNHIIVTVDDVEEKMKDVPKDDIVWLMIDMPPKSMPGSQNVAARWVEAHFSRVVGSSAEFAEKCAHKSVMQGAFEEWNVPHAHVRRIDYVPELADPEVLAELKEMGLPLFLKVDDGFNSLGLSDKCVAQTVEDAVAHAKDMLLQYGPVVIQRFLSGREFTVAVSPGLAYMPVERVFENGQVFSGPEGTKKEKLLDPILEDDHILKIQEAALLAYDSVMGSGYGRVDVRSDDKGNVVVLEVNNTCSIAHNSYFAMSLEACGVTRSHVFRTMLSKVL